ADESVARGGSYAADVRAGWQKSRFFLKSWEISPVAHVTKRVVPTGLRAKRLLSRLACSDTIPWATDRRSLAAFGNPAHRTVGTFRGRYLLDRRGQWQEIRIGRVDHARASRSFSGCCPLFFSFAMG